MRFFWNGFEDIGTYMGLKENSFIHPDMSPIADDDLSKSMPSVYVYPFLVM